MSTKVETKNKKDQNLGTKLPAAQKIGCLAFVYLVLV